MNVKQSYLISVKFHLDTTKNHSSLLLQNESDPCQHFFGNLGDTSFWREKTPRIIGKFDFPSILKGSDIKLSNNRKTTGLGI